jgi:hypothetical protein
MPALELSARELPRIRDFSRTNGGAYTVPRDRILRAQAAFRGTLPAP